MSVSAETRQTVRTRARFACEYCGITEEDAGGELTVDHFQPQSAGGADAAENLVYACFRCNLYKGDYWSETEAAPHIFNPRVQTSADHFWLAPNGVIYAVTATGAFTIQHLKLNRAPIVESSTRFNNMVVYWAMYGEDYNSLSEKAKLLLGTGNNKFIILRCDADAFFAEIMEGLGIGVPAWMDDPTQIFLEQSNEFAQTNNIDIRKKIKILGVTQLEKVNNVDSPNMFEPLL